MRSVVVYLVRRNNLASHNRQRKEMQVQPGKLRVPGFLRKTCLWYCVPSELKTTLIRPAVAVSERL